MWTYLHMRLHVTPLLIRISWFVASKNHTQTSRIHSTSGFIKITHPKFSYVLPNYEIQCIFQFSQPIYCGLRCPSWLKRNQIYNIIDPEWYQNKITGSLNSLGWKMQQHLNYNKFQFKLWKNESFKNVRWRSNLNVINGFVAIDLKWNGISTTIKFVAVFYLWVLIITTCGDIINPFATGVVYIRRLFHCLQWYTGSERVKPAIYYILMPTTFDIIKPASEILKPVFSDIIKPAQQPLIYFFFNTIFVSSHMHPENPEGTQVIVCSMNMGYRYIRRCQELNSQPVPSQAGADPTRPEWQTNNN